MLALVQAFGHKMIGVNGIGAIVNDAALAIVMS